MPDPQNCWLAPPHICLELFLKTAATSQHCAESCNFQHYLLPGSYIFLIYTFRFGSSDVLYTLGQFAGADAAFDGSVHLAETLQRHRGLEIVKNAIWSAFREKQYAWLNQMDARNVSLRQAV